MQRSAGISNIRGSVSARTRATRAAVFVVVLLAARLVEAAPVSPKTARSVAVNWLGEKGLPRSPAGGRVHSGGIAGGADYHVVNFDEGGWVVVAGDDASAPVLAYSPRGSFPRDRVPPSCAVWMRRVARAVRSGADDPAGRALALPRWERYARANGELPKAAPRGAPGDGGLLAASAEGGVGPLILTTWDQDAYYNTACPADAGSIYDGHALTGCIATCMAQLMKYFEYPATGVGSHSYYHPTYGTLSADFGATSYDWNAIPDSGPITWYNSAVATLMFHCGVAVEMDYSRWESAAYTSDAAWALATFFGYDEGIAYVERKKYSDTAWEAMVKAELDAGRPMLYGGDDGTGTVGHAFLCDGYDTSEPRKYHFNWGWSGYADGYFLLNQITPDTYNFSYGQEAIVGIQPLVLQELEYPYAQSFEAGTVPAEWSLQGTEAVISNDVARTGTYSIRLSREADHEELYSIAKLRINVPAGGAGLSFWAWRRFNAPSGDGNHQYAKITPALGGATLLTIFEGDYDDAGWQQFLVDLTPWAGQVVTLHLEVETVRYDYEWMYIDDVSVRTGGPLVDFASSRPVWFAGWPLPYRNATVRADAYDWQFPGGDPAAATAREPEVVYPEEGSYSATLTASAGGGTGVVVTKANAVTVRAPARIPYANNFNTDGGGFHPYALDNNSPQWEWGACDGPNFTGAYATVEGTGNWATSLNGEYDIYTRQALESPPFTFHGASGAYALSFSFRAILEANAGFRVEYSIDGGSLWQPLGSVGDPKGTGWYNAPAVPGLGAEAGWNVDSFSVRSASYDITFLSGQRDVRFRFVLGSTIFADYSYYYDGVQIDSFAISGNPTGPADLLVCGGDVEIADGDLTPGIDDGTDFGSAYPGESVAHAFSMKNAGVYRLALTGSPRIAVGGTHAADFAVSAQPGDHLHVGETFRFDVRFNATVPGSRSATITIASDDPDEPQYTFALAGTCVAKPEVSFASGTSTAWENDSHADIGVVLSSVTFRDVTVPVTLSGTAESPADYTTPAAQVMIPAGETRADFRVIPASDGVPEGKETVVLTLGLPSEALPGLPDSHVLTLADAGLPVLTAPSVFSPNEGTVGLFTATAEDRDAGEELTFSVSGADADALTIDPASGTVSFKTAPDSESPADSNGDGIYEFTVSVEDSTGNRDSVDVVVTVLDVNEFTPTVAEPDLLRAVVGYPYSCPIEVGDGDRDDAVGSLAVSLDAPSPGWLAIQPAPGGTGIVLTGTPGAGDAGEIPVTLRVTDTGGLEGTCPILLVVRPVTDTIGYAVSPGWNLLGIPFGTDGTTTPAIVFRDAGGQVLHEGAVSLYDCTLGTYVPVEAGFPGKRGFWVYSPSGGTTVPAAGPTEPVTDWALDLGWNLVGVVEDVPGDRLLASPGLHGVVWRWDAAAGLYQRVIPGETLRRGMGYWVFCTDPGAGPFRP